MRITFRLVISLVAVITFVVALFTYVQVRRDRALMYDEVYRKAVLLSESLQESIAGSLMNRDKKSLARVIEKFGTRDRVVGVVLLSSDGALNLRSPNTNSLPIQPEEGLKKSILEYRSFAELLALNAENQVYAYYYPFEAEDGTVYAIATYQRANHIQRRVRDLYQQGAIRLLLQAFLISLVTIFTIRWNVMAPLHRAAEWIKNLRLGSSDEIGVPLPKGLFGPLEKEVKSLATSFNSARAAAQEEAMLRQQGAAVWTSDRLREYVRAHMPGRKLLVVSNREPYMHVRRGKEVECIMPASGLVTALEPILRACGGTWVAQGAGNADREFTGEDDRLGVPPDHPQYQLRRVWITEQEEKGFYYGFANEGLWPLCHIAHTRPVFRAEDWASYQHVNQKFAAAVLEEIKDDEEPLVLIQDYHFALLPRLIKEVRPDARVALFWHIPWPNPESFGICPWQREILAGMLGADLIGFHIQYHCNNFLDTVDRALESRINWEQFSVNRQNHKTTVKPFPISVALTPLGSSTPKPPVDKAALLKKIGASGEFLAVGVDRLDYTKGLVERIRAVERFLEKNPEYIGRFVFVELGAPSRDLIKRYHDFIEEVEHEVVRINGRFRTKDWQPLVLLKKHHSHSDIDPFYRAADLCLVTSLHDGMNLVAKEYVAARSDEDGVLILSRFAGASRELPDALIVNPYDIERMADAIRSALVMDADERQRRMRHMRGVVMSNNIYRWGGTLIDDLTQIRLHKPVSSSSPV